MINEFLTLRTNQRSDQWGGDYHNRMRFAVEVVSAVRERVGNDFIIIYRLSMSTCSRRRHFCRNGRTGAGHRSGWRNHY
ncbi:hypothetical protein ACNKHR_17160 [Shigella flexneri]